MQPPIKREGLLQNPEPEQRVVKHTDMDDSDIDFLDEYVLKPRDYQRSVAQLGEQLAAEWLESNGYKIIDRNWRCGRYSEIDLVAFDPQELLTFIEVKTRRLDPMRKTDPSSLPQGFPVDYDVRSQAFETLNWKKRRKIITGAMAWIHFHDIEDPACQLDAIVITYEHLVRKGNDRALLGTSVFHVPAAFSEV